MCAHHPVSGISEDRSLRANGGQSRGLYDFRSVSARPITERLRFSRPASLRAKFPFPRIRSAFGWRQVRVLIACQSFAGRRRLSGSGKAKRSVLLRPFDRQIAQAGNSYSAWQPAMNGSFDEIGCKEGKRNRHVDLADAAVFSCSDRLDIWCCP